MHMISLWMAPRYPFGPLHVSVFSTGRSTHCSSSAGLKSGYAILPHPQMVQSSLTLTSTPAGGRTAGIIYLLAWVYKSVSVGFKINLSRCVSAVSIHLIETTQLVQSRAFYKKLYSKPSKTTLSFAKLGTFRRTRTQDKNDDSFYILQKRNFRINSQTHQYWKIVFRPISRLSDRGNTIFVQVSTYVAFDGTKHNIMQGLSVIVWML